MVLGEAEVAEGVLAGQDLGVPVGFGADKAVDEGFNPLLYLIAELGRHSRR